MVGFFLKKYAAIPNKKFAMKLLKGRYMECSHFLGDCESRGY